MVFALYESSGSSPPTGGGREGGVGEDQGDTEAEEGKNLD